MWTMIQTPSSSLVHGGCSDVLMCTCSVIPPSTLSVRPQHPCPPTCPGASKGVGFVCVASSQLSGFLFNHAEAPVRYGNASFLLTILGTPPRFRQELEFRQPRPSGEPPRPCHFRQLCGGLSLCPQPNLKVKFGGCDCASTGDMSLPFHYIQSNRTRLSVKLCWQHQCRPEQFVTGPSKIHPNKHSRHAS